MKSTMTPDRDLPCDFCRKPIGNTYSLNQWCESCADDHWANDKEMENYL